MNHLTHILFTLESTKLKMLSEEKKIIYISHVHLSKRIADDWYINEFMNLGVFIEYWDITEIYRDPYTEANEISTNYVKKINNIKDFENLIIDQASKAKFIVLTKHDTKNYKIYSIFRKHKASIYTIAWGAMPSPKALIKNKLYKILETNPQTILKKIKDSLIFKVLKLLNLIQPFEISFVAGKYWDNSNIITRKKSYINSIDFEKNKKYIKNTKERNNQKYAVFLDGNLPFHPDIKLNSLVGLNPTVYYSKLDNFFSLIESRYNLKIVIAAHPTFSNSNKSYLCRRMSECSTVELIKNCTLVIAHHSTSISYAVLNFKPIIFIYTKEMFLQYKYSIMEFIKCLSEELDSPYIGIDEDLDKKYELKISTKKYLDFKYKYICSEISEQNENVETIINEIFKIYN